MVNVYNDYTIITIAHSSTRCPEPEQQTEDVIVLRSSEEWQWRYEWIDTWFYVQVTEETHKTLEFLLYSVEMEKSERGEREWKIGATSQLRQLTDQSIYETQLILTRWDFSINKSSVNSKPGRKSIQRSPCYCRFNFPPLLWTQQNTVFVGVVS